MQIWRWPRCFQIINQIINNIIIAYLNPGGFNSGSACALARTLKPSTIYDAAASVMSLSVMTTSASTARLQLHPYQFFGSLRNGSTEPCTSPLTTSAICDVAVLELLHHLVSEAARGAGVDFSRALRSRYSATSRARASFQQRKTHHLHRHAARLALQPVPTARLSICSPWSLISARTRPT